MPANKLSCSFADLQTSALHTLQIAYCAVHIADMCNSDKKRTAAKQFHNLLRSNFETFDWLLIISSCNYLDRTFLPTHYSGKEFLQQGASLDHFRVIGDVEKISTESIKWWANVSHIETKI